MSCAESAPLSVYVPTCDVFELEALY